MWKKITGKVIDINTREVLDDTPTEGTPEEDPLEYLKRMTEPGELVRQMRQSLQGDDFDRFRGITREDINEGRVCHTTMRGCGFNKGYLNDPPEQHPELAHPDCPMHGDEYRKYQAELDSSIKTHPAGKGGLTLVPNEHDSHIKESGLGDVWDSIKYHVGEAWENMVADPVWSIGRTIHDKLATHDVPEEGMMDHLQQGHGIPATSTDSAKQMRQWHENSHGYMQDMAEIGRPMEHNPEGFGAEADRVETQYQQRTQDAQEWAKNNVQYNVAHIREARVMSNEFIERRKDESVGWWVDEELTKESGLLNDWANILPGPFKSTEEKALESANTQAAAVAAGGTYTPIAERPEYTPPPPPEPEEKNVYSPITGQGQPKATPSAVQRNETINNIIKNTNVQELPQWIQDVIEKEAHGGMYSDDPQAQDENSRLEQSREEPQTIGMSDDEISRLQDNRYCGICDEHQNDHCQSCGECPGDEHLSGCPQDNGAPIGKSRDDFDDSMDGDFDSGMASAGFGTDEDYGYYGE